MEIGWLPRKRAKPKAALSVRSTWPLATSTANFTHEFKDSQIFIPEQDAVLHGLREGMIWIDMEISRTIRV